MISSFLASCLPEQNTASTTSSDAGDTTTSGTTGTNGSGSTTGTTGTTGTNGSTGTTGTTGSTGGGGFPVHGLSIRLAGEGYMAQTTEAHKESVRWYPKSTMDSSFISVEEASYMFQTDSLLRVKFNVQTQPTSCFAKASGVAIPAYGMLQFDVSLVAIKCPNGGTNCSPSQYILGTPYNKQTVGPVNVNSSTILDLSNKLSNGVVATAIRIDNVSSDQYCDQYPNHFCPASRIMRAQDCWGINLEVQTSYTQSL